ncbi:MAG: tRNA (guanine(10)-N(2))-dimethyltransferase [Methanobrevibacter sp.]|nr:tRNA (guanine(10)-N(2))-dimethyltransferase [Methanobrevibacter sp.]
MKNQIKTNVEEIEIINEGLVEISVPKFDKVSSSAPVFYNPRMELNRDISILALQTFQEEVNREINICDVFGGSGIRAIRYKKEINGVGEVFLNDISSLAIEQSKINSIANNVDIEIHQKEANIFLRENRGMFDVIDIDPFGTPSYFLDSASYSLKKDSLLCVTATDTSALCGTYKEPCIRKYNAKPYKSEYYHENGIRILAGFVGLTLAKYKKYIEDIKLSHSSEHYMRLYIKINKGSAATDESLANNIGHIIHCKKCLFRKAITGLTTTIPEICPVCREKIVVAGPMWIGKLQNSEFIAKMIEKLSEDNPKISENNPNITENNYNVIENNPKISENNYDVSEDNPNVSEDNPKIGEDNPNITENNYNVIENNPNVSEDNLNINENNYNINENNINRKIINTEKKALKLLNSCFEESNAPITSYDIHVICRNLKISAPKLESIMDKIKEEGFIATKTHFNPVAIKSDIEIEKLKDIVKLLSV